MESVFTCGNCEQTVTVTAPDAESLGVTVQDVQGRHALTHKAADIGKLHGKRAAGWVTDGNTTRERYQELLKGIEDGDPMVLDSVREPGFTGEYGDDYSEDDLLHDVGIQRMETDTEDVDEIVNAWIDAARDAFWQEIERVCRYQLED